MGKSRCQLQEKQAKNFRSQHYSGFSRSDLYQFPLVVVAHVRYHLLRQNLQRENNFLCTFVSLFRAGKDVLFAFRWRGCDLSHDRPFSLVRTKEARKYYRPEVFITCFELRNLTVGHEERVFREATSVVTRSDDFVAVRGKYPKDFSVN